MRHFLLLEKHVMCLNARECGMRSQCFWKYVYVGKACITAYWGKFEIHSIYEEGRYSCVRNSQHFAACSVLHRRGFWLLIPLTCDAEHESTKFPGSSSDLEGPKPDLRVRLRD
jgi:hypothetical protein